ncbi:unnamed protein product [Leuciscus chuanchicus]
MRRSPQGDARTVSKSLSAHCLAGKREVPRPTIAAWVLQSCGSSRIFHPSNVTQFTGIPDSSLVTLTPSSTLVLTTHCFTLGGHPYDIAKASHITRFIGTSSTGPTTPPSKTPTLPPPPRGVHLIAILRIRWFSIRKIWPASLCSSSNNTGMEGACVATSDYFIIGGMIIVANIQDTMEAGVVGRC